MSQKENEGDEGGSFRRCYPGWCSFCRKHSRDVGPLAEGPDVVLICYGCTQVCAKLIEDQCRHRGVAQPGTVERWWEKEVGAPEQGPEKGTLLNPGEGWAT
jgi:hypothetical protein